MIIWRRAATPATAANYAIGRIVLPDAAPFTHRDERHGGCPPRARRPQLYPLPIASPNTRPPGVPPRKRFAHPACGKKSACAWWWVRMSHRHPLLVFGLGLDIRTIRTASLTTGLPAVAVDVLRHARAGGYRAVPDNIPRLPLPPKCRN